MITPLVISVGMPRAGSGWYYNLIHDLIVAGGGKDAHWIRKRFFLGPILTEVNNNIGAFTSKRLLPAMVPAWLGNKYVIKAHAGPTPLTLRFIRSGKLHASYIYRDPRDALLSAYEYGQRKRAAGRTGPFSDLETIEDAILFMEEYVRIAVSWLECREVLHTRYENLIQDYNQEAEKVALFFNLDICLKEISTVIDKYHPNKGSKSQVGTHYVKGKIGRYREIFSDRHKQMCIDRFGYFLDKMGYPIP